MLLIHLLEHGQVPSGQFLKDNWVLPHLTLLSGTISCEELHFSIFIIIFKDFLSISFFFFQGECHHRRLQCMSVILNYESAVINPTVKEASLHIAASRPHSQIYDCFCLLSARVKDHPIGPNYFTWKIYFVQWFGYFSIALVFCVECLSKWKQNQF